MARRNIITGIDVGTHSVRVIIAEKITGQVLPRIIGTGITESKGLRRGYVVNSQEATKSIKRAISAAQRKAKVVARSAFISIGGVGLESVMAQGTTVISRADSEATQMDVDNAISSAEESIGNFANKKVIDTIPVKYKLDGKDVLGYPQGMKGSKLEVKALFITCLKQHIEELIHATEDAGVDVEAVIPSPVAASLVALSKRQRTVGVLLINIGAETVSVVTFEEDIPISLQVFPMGSSDLTNDIALGLQVPIEKAEDLKIGRDSNSVSRKKLEYIIEARLSDIFELIEAHLKKIGRNGLLPAGVVITGGGAGLSTIEDLSKAILKLPALVPLSQRGIASRVLEQFQDSSWFVVYGLCVYGSVQNKKTEAYVPFKNIRDRGISWLKQLIP